MMASRESARILVVDDDAVQRALLREILGQAGYSCDDAQDGEHAGSEDSAEGAEPGLCAAIFASHYPQTLAN